MSGIRPYRATEMVIEPRNSGGRSFTADLIAHASTKRTWAGDDADTIRPVWAVFAGPTEQLRAFVANLKLGHQAMTVLPRFDTRGAVRLELLRSAGYTQWVRDLPGGGSAVTFVLPQVMSREIPSEPHMRARFACMPSLSWLAAQRHDLATARNVLVRLELDAYEQDGVGRGVVEQGNHYNSKSAVYGPKLALASLSDAELHRYLGYGAALVQCMDERLRYPVPRAALFGAWLLLVGVENGPISMVKEERTVVADALTSTLRSSGSPYLWTVHRPEAAGCAPGFLFNILRLTHYWREGAAEECLQKWLSVEVRRWYRMQRKGVLRGAA